MSFTSNLIIIVGLFRGCTGREIIETFCPDIGMYYGCISFKLGFIDDLIYNNSTCNCSFYGFPEETCADSIFKDVDNWRESVNVTFDAILNGTKYMMKYFAYFITKYGRCADITTPTKKLRIPVVDSCPEDVKGQNTFMCTNPPSPLPPYEFRMHVTVVFKNVFCALCNGIDEDFIKSRMTSWGVDYTCENPQLANNPIPVKDECQVTFTPPLKWKDVQCEILLMSVVQLNSEVCPNCEKGSKFTLDCIMCKLSFVGYDSQCGDPLKYKISLRTLFELPDRTAVLVNGKLRDSSEFCSDDEKYDHLFLTCRKIVCTFDEFPVKGRCIKNSTITLTPDLYLQPNGTKLVNLTVFQAIANYMHEFVSLDIQMNILSFKDSLHEYSDGNYTMEAWLQIDITNSSGADVIQYISSLQLQDYKYNYDKTRFTLSNFPLPEDDICPTKIVCTNETKLVLRFSWFVEAVVENRTYIAPLFNSIFELMIETNPDRMELTQFCFCRPRLISSFNCSFQRFLYQENEFNVSDDGILTIRYRKLTFEPTQYEITDEGVIVCLNPAIFKLTAFFDMNPIQTYVSVACTSLSIVCLIITIILYCLLPDLRNLPGKLTMGLSLSLILAQGLLILPNLPRPICRYFAAVTHYSWLTVFMWMAVIAVNMLRTFHPKTMHGGSEWLGGNAFIRLSSICLISPAVLCIILAILDQFPGGHLHVNYGQASCLWMSNIDGYIYMFFVPVGTVLLISSVCFCMTLYYIEKTMAATDMITGRKRDRERCVMYIKLSSVMGFSWIFGFVASFSNVEALWYVYIILNGLQGVFIFFSFGMTSRTRKMALERVSEKYKYSASSRSTTTTTKTTATTNTP